MLKIKDNVDLKELEKFGYVYIESGHYYCKDNIYCIDKKTRQCYVSLDYKDEDIADYDLIKADLVEKVSDGK